MSWLRVNLLGHVPEHPHRLADIDPELMARLVASPDLFVMQTEFSVYVLLRSRSPRTRLWAFKRICAQQNSAGEGVNMLNFTNQSFIFNICR